MPEPRQMQSEGAYQSSVKLWYIATAVLLLAYALFQIYTGYFRFPNYIQRSIHVGLALVLCFILFSARRGARTKPGAPPWDIFLIILAVISTGYIAVNWEHIIMQQVGLQPHELVLGIIMILLILEAGRRVIGWVFPILTTLSIFYAVAGPIFPGRFSHPPISWVTVVETLYFGGEGIWGFFTGISATVIALFIILAPILLASGGARTFHDVSLRVAGLTTGGAAKAATFMSAGFGTVSGSCIANVATTGAFTIPMMKRLGYPPALAGAVEAAASTGGQIMPPVMGAGAFLMAVLLGIPCLKIARFATLPAIFYFAAVTTGIHFEAKRIGLKPVPKELIPPAREFLTVRRLMPIVLPLGVLLGALLKGYTPGFSAMLAVLTAILLYVFVGGSFATQQMFLRTREMGKALQEGARALIFVAVLITCAQIVVTMIGLTGFGIKFSNLIITASGQSMVLALVLAMVVAMLLGMGLPTTAAYLLGVSVVGAALMRLGVIPIAAHMFIFYFAILSAITPPVCTAVFVASPIAGAPWLRVGWYAFRLALPAFIIPFAFVFDPSLMLVDPGLSTIPSLITMALGVLAMGAGAMGYLFKPTNVVQRLALLTAAVLLIAPGILTDVIGFGLLATTYLSQRINILRLIQSRIG